MITLQQTTDVVIEYPLAQPLDNGQDTMTMQTTSPIMLEGGEYVRHYGDKQVYRVDEGQEYFSDKDDLDTAWYVHQAVVVHPVVVWLKLLFNRRFNIIRLGA